MRIVSWNCNGGLKKKLDAMLALEPDIAVIQECSRRDLEASGATTVAWTGRNPHRGLGIAAFGCTSIVIRDDSESETPWYLTASIHRGALHLLGLWATVHQGPKRYVRVAHDIVDRCTEFLAVDHAIAIGDFNSNAIWDARYRGHSHTDLVAKFGKIGLTSAYHSTRGEADGQELTPTHYLYRHRDRPYHLDYGFLSTRLMPSATFTIGDPAEWLKWSDHMPLVVDIDLPKSRTDLAMDFDKDFAD